MAQKKHTEPKGGKKAKGPQKKPGFGTRIRQFIGGLRNELKRVVWPDKKTLKQTAIAVAIIIALAVGMIFIVDSILGAALRASGFDTPGDVIEQTAQATPTPEVTEAIDLTDTSSVPSDEE